jgi:DNA-binding response OmpR family regulator
MAKILIIEDDLDMSFSMEAFLKMEKYSVESVVTGREGLERLKFYQYDVVILDWGLPDTTGIDVLKEYRGRGGKAPVLMLTGKSAVSEKETGLDSGADDYLTKPFHPKELSARIRALLRRPSTLPTETFRLKNIMLDSKARRVSRDGQDVSLAPSEFALLEFLLRHPNEVFTPEALLDRVWPTGSEASPATVRTCIKKIRQKIDVDEDNSIIKNIPGVGYRVDSE